MLKLIDQPTPNLPPVDPTAESAGEGDAAAGDRIRRSATVYLQQQICPIIAHPWEPLPEMPAGVIVRMGEDLDDDDDDLDDDDGLDDDEDESAPREDDGLGTDEEDDLDEFDDFDEDDFDDDFDDDFEEEFEDDYEIEIDDDLSELGISSPSVADDEDEGPDKKS